MSKGDRPDDLDRRRADLERALAARKPVEPEADEGTKRGGMAGMGIALRLSSEFIAGVLGGALVGWLVDEFAGTGPWGLIVFLLLGFAAGVLNLLRSAGVMQDSYARLRQDRDEK